MSWTGAVREAALTWSVLFELWPSWPVVSPIVASSDSGDCAFAQGPS
jgi:hypothetical protein